MKTSLKSVSATEIKNRFGDYLGEVIHGAQPLLVEKHGKPVAVVMKFDDWLKAKGGSEARVATPWVEACIRLGQEIEKSHPKSKPFSAVRLVRQVRESREEEI